MSDAAHKGIIADLPPKQFASLLDIYDEQGNTYSLVLTSTPKDSLDFDLQVEGVSSAFKLTLNLDGTWQAHTWVPS